MVLLNLLILFAEHPQQCLSGQFLTILEHMFYPRNIRGKKSVLYYIDEVC